MAEAKPIDAQVLTDLQTQDIEDSFAYAAKLKIDHTELYGELNSLQQDDYIKLEPKTKQVYDLTPEGVTYSVSGTPEYGLYKLIPAEGIKKDDLQKLSGFNDATMKIAFSKGVKVLFAIGEGQLIKRIAEDLKDTDAEQLKLIKEGQPAAKIKDLIKRQCAVEKKLTYFKVTKGASFAPVREKLEAEITADTLNNWNTKKLKAYNWKAQGKEIESGNLHPLMKVKKQYREVLLEMGFEEMPTNQFVESCFYNFDALFVPQQHPARDEHDTFFVSDPEKAKIDNQVYMQEVKNIHEKGGYGSIGYNYEWSENVSKQNVFRTHTTAVTSRMLSKLGEESKKGAFQAKKYFSIDRVFRNETLDSTHLAEFHQIEGIVADRNVGLGHLIGIFTEFFEKIGMKNLYFKPTYNPYTEPSLEIHGWHPILGKIVELGNSGVFRPEMLRPMGLPEDVNVLGWGLGLERPTMIQYGYENIRELFGYKVDLKMVKSNAIVALK